MTSLHYFDTYTEVLAYAIKFMVCFVFPRWIYKEKMKHWRYDLCLAQDYFCSSTVHCINTYTQVFLYVCTLA